MDDLQLIVLCQRHLWPVGARNDLAVVLYGNAVSFDSKFLNQIFEIDGWSEFGKDSWLTIDNERDRHVS